IFLYPLPPTGLMDDIQIKIAGGVGIAANNRPTGDDSMRVEALDDVFHSLAQRGKIMVIQRGPTTFRQKLSIFIAFRRGKTPTLKSGMKAPVFAFPIHLGYPLSPFGWTITTQAYDGMVAEKVQCGAAFQLKIGRAHV